ncbi:hypothetical protein [Acinetobacter baumannii]|uniref:hypothetical protein n=1 Tax=Acinetobacter baumannii TaxID=470 RepID=UPI001AD7E71F|nr:hypothetical protein [Acinetobacter baumannii]
MEWFFKKLIIHKNFKLFIIMNDSSGLLKDFIENKPLYSGLYLLGKKGTKREFNLREIQGFCSKCESEKPFHNDSTHDRIGFLLEYEEVIYAEVFFRCVSCRNRVMVFWLRFCQIDDSAIIVEKIGQFPQKELPRSKLLSKFFKSDKEEYNKAIICIANGYGVAAFAYMRRIVENNIVSLLEQIQEGVDKNSDIAKSVNDLKATSPMSDRIKIANNALPDYLKPDGFNPLGQIYALLSDGVHSLTDKECLEKAENIQACLEFMISELAAHKQNKEDFKKRLAALKK